MGWEATYLPIAPLPFASPCACAYPCWPCHFPPTMLPPPAACPLPPMPVPGPMLPAPSHAYPPLEREAGQTWVRRWVARWSRGGERGGSKLGVGGQAVRSPTSYTDGSSLDTSASRGGLLHAPPAASPLSLHVSHPDPGLAAAQFQLLQDQSLSWTTDCPRPFFLFPMLLGARGDRISSWSHVNKVFLTQEIAPVLLSLGPEIEF